MSERLTANKSLNYALVCLAPIVWGASGIFVRWTDLAGREQAIIFWRSLFAVGFYLVLITVLRRWDLLKPSGQAPLLIVSGLLTAGFGMCVFKAYVKLPIGVATFILYLFPVIVALLAPVLLKEKLQPVTLACLAIALAGTGMLWWGRGGENGESSTLGLLFAAGSALLWALMFITWKKLRENTSALTIGTWTNAVAVVATAPFAIPLTGQVTGKAWGAIVVFGVLNFGLVGLAYIYGLKGVKAQVASTLSYLEPVSAMALGLIFLNETPRWQDLAGALLIVFAGLLLLKLHAGDAEEQQPEKAPPGQENRTGR